MTDTEIQSTFVPLATFDCYMVRWTGNARDDRLDLTFGIKPEHKYDAMPVTDHPGLMLRVTVEKLSYGESGE